MALGARPYCLDARHTSIRIYSVAADKRQGLDERVELTQPSIPVPSPSCPQQTVGPASLVGFVTQKFRTNEQSPMQHRIALSPSISQYILMGRTADPIWWHFGTKYRQQGAKILRVKCLYCNSDVSATAPNCRTHYNNCNRAPRSIGRLGLSPTPLPPLRSSSTAASAPVTSSTTTTSSCSTLASSAMTTGTTAGTRTSRSVRPLC